MENLAEAIESQLSKKLKTLSEFFVAHLKSTLNFEHFERKHEPDS